VGGPCEKCGGRPSGAASRGGSGATPVILHHTSVINKYMHTRQIGVSSTMASHAEKDPAQALHLTRTGAPLPPRLAAPFRRPPHFSHGPPRALHTPIPHEKHNRQHTSPSAITSLYSYPRNLQPPPHPLGGTGIERISSNS
jgi:hypothetical protein